MSTPTTHAGPCALPDVDRALAATRQANQVDLALVGMEILAKRLEALFKPGGCKRQDRGRLREALRGLCQATHHAREEDNGNGTQEVP